MAQQSPATAAAEPSHMDPSVNERDWEVFIGTAKWFALAILAVTFFLIMVVIGHQSWLWTGIFLVAFAFILGKLFH